MSIEDFMKSPLVRWVQLFKTDPVTYSNLCDGAFLGDVMRQIDPGANLMGMNMMVTEFKERLQNWDIVINSILSYYQTVLQQFVIMRLPNIITICKLPYSEMCRTEIQRALLLVLGCAVQCERRQSFIEKIKSLSLSDQEVIMHSITQVTDCPGNILPVESLGEKVDDPSSGLCSYVAQLLRERQENRSQIQDVTIALEELQKEKGGQTPSGAESNAQFASNVTPSKSKNNVNLPGQIRRLQLELDEKSAENQELHEELDRLNRTAEKLRNENVDLIKEASAARAYRDELDIVQEKANLAKKYELENTKLREKLNELDFLRARIKEINSENSLLLESKLEIEEKLTMSEKQFEAVRDLEEQLSHCKRHLESVSAERDSDRKKLHELSEENARLVLEKRTSESQNISLEEELKSVRLKSDSSGAMSLSEQLSELATSKLRRLELENQKLREQVTENKDDSSSTLKIGELKKENERLRSKVKTLEQTVVEDKRTELKQLKLLQQSSDMEDGSSKVQSVRLSGNEAEPDIENFEDETEEVVDHRIRNLGNKKLIMEFQTARSDLAKTSLDHQQLMMKHKAFTSESSQQIRMLEQEKDALDRENIELKNTVAGLRLVFEKYSDAEKTASELRVENEKLTKKLAALESSVAKASALEQENTRLRIDVECLQLTVENQKNSSSKVVDLEHEKDVMNRQLLQLQSSLESSKADRMMITTLEHDLTRAIDEKIQLKRHLESAMNELESSRVSYVQLESHSDHLQKSMESFEMAKKKFDIIQHKNDKLEAENQCLMAGKSALEKDNMRLRQIGEERKVRAEELCGKLAELEVANKELVRNLERTHWSKAMRVRETESLHESKEADYKRDSEQMLVLEKEQHLEDLIVDETKSTPLSAIPVQVVAPSRTGTSSNSLNMTNPMTEHIDNGAYAVEHGRDQGRHGTLNHAQGALDPDVELRRDIVRLERKNAVLEEENRNLKDMRSQLQMRLDETERQYSVAHSELSSIRGQCHALQAQLEKLQADGISLTPKNALLEAENASLSKECSDLRSRLSQALDKERTLSLINIKLELEIGNIKKQMENLSAEHTQLKNEHARLKLELQQINDKYATEESDRLALKTKHSELENDHLTLQNEHSKLKSERDELINEQSELMMDHKAIAERASQLEERCFQLTKEAEDLSEWKLQNDRLQAEVTSDRSAELVDARTEIARLRRKASEGRKSLEKLQAENEKVKDKWSRVIRRQEDVEKELADAREQLNEAVKENNRLASKCEVFSQVQLRLEEENHALMIQLQALMNQNQDLLTQILSSKDHYAEEQKSYLNQLSELRRQKEKLEEKLIEQSRQKDLAKKKKGFGAFVKRAFLKDKKSKDRNKTSNDLELSRRTLSELELTPRSLDDRSLTSTSNNSLVMPQSMRREGHSQNLDGVNRSGSDMPDGDRMQVSQQKVLTTTRPLVDGDSEDEKLTLEEFLQECNQTPMARRKLLVNKKNSTGRNGGRSGMQGKDSPHRSSLLTLFHPQSTHSNDGIGTSRQFQSELNLFRGSLPRPSETSSANITSTPVRPVRERNHRKWETVEHAAEVHDTEPVQSVRTLVVPHSNEQSTHRRIPSNSSSVMRKHSFCRVITAQADVVLSSPATNSRQDPVVPPVSNASLSSASESSNLSHNNSSRQSLNTSHTLHNSTMAQQTSFHNLDNLRTTEPVDERMKPGFTKDNKHDLVEGKAGSSPSNGDFSERADISSSSSSSVRSRQSKLIPFIDEVEHEEVTYRESNVCI